MNKIQTLKLQFGRFVVVGVISTIVNYSTFYALYKLLEVNYLIASSVGFMAGVGVGYFINKSWTFEYTLSSPIVNSKLVVKYYLVYGFSLLLSLGFLKITVAYFKVDPIVANLLAIGITTITNFCGIKLLVFNLKTKLE